MRTKTICQFLPLILLMLVLGCSKKEDATPDPRDQYVGTWTEISETRNGASQPITTPDVLIVTKSASSSTGLTFSISGTTFTVTLLSTGFTADNTSIPVGTYTFSDKTQAPAYSKNLTGNISGGQLAIKYTEYAQSATFTHTVEDTEVFTKK